TGFGLYALFPLEPTIVTVTVLGVVGVRVVGVDDPPYDDPPPQLHMAAAAASATVAPLSARDCMIPPEAEMRASAYAASRIPAVNRLFTATYHSDAYRARNR